MGQNTKSPPPPPPSIALRHAAHALFLCFQSVTRLTTSSSSPRSLGVSGGRSNRRCPHALTFRISFLRAETSVGLPFFQITGTVVEWDEVRFDVRLMQRVPYEGISRMQTSLRR